ncbi:MAG: ferritin-like domain-containing protein [Bacteroidales bacterium]
MPKPDSLEPLMIDELRDILDAEKQVTKALPKMAKAASSEKLKAAFQEHLRQTSGQIERLNQVFEELGERARGKKCEAMQGLIAEGQKMAAEIDAGPTRDALLIAAAQKVEHYEIAAYGTARTFANQLGHSRAASLLEETLEEEKATDEKLTGIAESTANPRAAGNSEQGQGEGRRRSGGAARSGYSNAEDRGGRSTRRTRSGNSRSRRG